MRARPHVASVIAVAVIAQQVMVKTTRDTLFLSHFAVDSMPRATAATAIASGLVTLGYAKAFARWSPARVVPPLFALSGALLVLAWALCERFPAAGALAVYAQSAVFGAAVVSSFFSLIGEVFDPHTARVAMGRIAAGAALGGVLGGLATCGMASVAGVPSTLLVAAALNGACAYGTRALAPPAAQATAVSSCIGCALRGTPYLRLLAALTLLVAAAEMFLEYVVSSRAAGGLGGGARLLAFFAAFQSASALLGLLVQLFLPRAAAERLGLGATLAIVPIAVVVAGSLGLVVPGLLTAAFARGAQGTLRTTFFRSGYETLFAPLPDAVKRSTKTVIDVGFDRLGTTLASGAAVALVALLPARAGSVLLALAIVLSLASILVIRAIHRGYVKVLADGLSTDAEATDLLAARPTMTTLRGTGARLDRDALLRRIGSAATSETPAAQAARLIPHLATPALAFDALRALEPIAPSVVGQLVDALVDPATDPAVRRRIPALLRRTRSRRAVDGLVLALDDRAAEVQERSALALQEMRLREPSSDAPPEPVRAALVREIAAGAPRLEHAFVLLSLLLPRAPIAPALRALDTTDERLRGTALEYLHEVLPEDLRQGLWPHIVDRRPPAH